MLKKVKSIIKAVFTAATFCFLNVSVFATSDNRIIQSDIGQGTLALVNDISGTLLWLGPTICAAAAVIFIVRRSMVADEQMGKRWFHAAVISCICGILMLLVSGLISLITGYYI